MHDKNYLTCLDESQDLSALNSWYADMGLPKPAVGQAITMLRRGYGEVQGDEDDEKVCT
jgi:hypothetical protein